MKMGRACHLTPQQPHNYWHLQSRESKCDHPSENKERFDFSTDQEAFFRKEGEDSILPLPRVPQKPLKEFGLVHTVSTSVEFPW